MSDSVRRRIGIDAGRKLRLEDAVDWAIRHQVAYLDVQLDDGANAFTRIDASRSAAVRRTCERHGLRLGLHTLSAVNVAETAPLVGEAVDAYLRGYVDAAVRLGAGWIVVHAGYHFSADMDRRMHAALDRLRRTADYAEAQGALLLLENLNKEPPDAEVHYLAHTLAEWRWFYERIDSPALALSFTANHAHLVPEGVAGFLEAMPLERVAEVRLADCWRNGREEHLRPGEGDFDFAALFAALAARRWDGHFMAAFGSLEEMLAGRERLAALG
jgi:sugar phosphate isomerase/epimerase